MINYNCLITFDYFTFPKDESFSKKAYNKNIIKLLIDFIINIVDNQYKYNISILFNNFINNISSNNNITISWNNKKEIIYSKIVFENK